ncbi:MAG: diacylglycerol kinase family protein [Sphingomicrobium sp.]
MKAIVLINKGGGSAGDDARDKVAAALAKAGIDGEVELLDGAALADRAKAAVKDGAPLIIAAGGDGTQSAVAGAIAGSETVMGILPLGTLNHLARDLGISFDLDDAAAVIAAGRTHRIDVASLNGRIFVNNSAIGLYPLMVEDREGQQDRLGRSKKLAMIVAGLRTLARYRHHRLSLTVNESETATLDTPLLFVGNNDYRMEMPRAGYRDRLDDGRLSVVVMKRQGRLALFAAMLRALAGRSRPQDLIRLDDVTRLSVASRRHRLTVSSDGETLHLAPPLDYRIFPAALTVMVP